jgi:hypothetical protein
VNDSTLRLGSKAASDQEQPRRRGWLKPGLVLILLVLVLGFTMAGSARSDIKATSRLGQAFGKDARAWLASADFQFTGQGWIMGGAGNTWLVSGVPIQVDEHTQIIGALNVGDSVTLSGRILDSGAWLADRIERADIQQPVFTFNGLLSSIEPGAWRIGSTTLALNESSEVDAGLAVNDPVLATFTPLEGGTWLALRIEPFDKPWVEPTPIPTATPTPSLATTSEPQKKAAPSARSEPPPKAPKNQGKVTICHNPNHKNGGKTMIVDGAALQSHLGHGDRLGPCR